MLQNFSYLNIFKNYQSEFENIKRSYDHFFSEVFKISKIITPEYMQIFIDISFNKYLYFLSNYKKNNIIMIIII